MMSGHSIKGKIKIKRNSINVLLFSECISKLLFQVLTIVRKKKKRKIKSQKQMLIGIDLN